LLRAYARYLRQLQFPYSVEYIAETMANHLHITACIVELFLTRFSPVFDGDEDWRGQRELAVEERILDSLEEVQNLGEDRIIRQYVRIIKATLRTNFFQEADGGTLKPYFSFKFRPSAIPDIPQPVPMFEIYVYSPRVEGVHLRGGKVAEERRYRARGCQGWLRGQAVESRDVPGRATAGGYRLLPALYSRPAGSH
jgi:glutamate dehydrogenase